MSLNTQTCSVWLKYNIIWQLLFGFDSYIIIFSLFL